MIKKQNASGKCVAGVVVEPVQSEGGIHFDKCFLVFS